MAAVDRSQRPGAISHAICSAIAKSKLVRDRAIERLWQRLAAAPDGDQRAKLDQLLVVPAGERVSPLERLRRGPTRTTAPALAEALRRLAEVRALGVGELNLSSIPAGHIRTLARYAATTWASVIARMPAARRAATLVAFARVFEATAQDDALDVLDLMIGTLLARVENEGDQARLRTLRDLDTAALRLRDACRVALDPRYSDLDLREAILAHGRCRGAAGDGGHDGDRADAAAGGPLVRGPAEPLCPAAPGVRNVRAPRYPRTGCRPLRPPGTLHLPSWLVYGEVLRSQYASLNDWEDVVCRTRPPNRRRV